MKSTLYSKLFYQCTFALVFLCASSIGNSFDALSISALKTAEEGSSVETQPDYCNDFEAFAERFVRPEFPQDAPEDVQRSWYAQKKTCGRDLIKLSLAKWPVFDSKPDDVGQNDWDEFVAAVGMSRFSIGEAIFDENHGGTLIKKYYFTDYEPDKIVALRRKALEEIDKIEQSFDDLTKDVIWKASYRARFDAFLADFDRWFAPYCRASLDKLPPLETYVKEPDVFLAAADLLEFAVDFIPNDEKFISVLDGVSELIKAPKAVEIRVFHGRYEGFNLVPRDEIFARYCRRIEGVRNRRSEERITPKLIEASVFNERQTELFEHGSLPRWGAKNPEQKDTFYVVFPKKGPAENRPLYVVLHSAGHSAKTALDCTSAVGNHDIYTVPDDFYGLFVDCYANKDVDWWWGGRRADESEINNENAEKATSEYQPVEKRVFDEIAWAIDTFKIDSNRVYLCGNSMGGSGTLGLGLRNGHIFAAIKANVPAGVWQAYDRLQLGEEDAPVGIADPPICLDYSAPNDSWSVYHEVLFKGVETRKYSYIAYWGNYGHENNDEKVAQYNDLFKTFDWTSIRKDEAYPVFTNASTDSDIPWPDKLENAPAGQRGAYFRWKNKTDSPDKFEMELRLATAEELQSKIFNIPTVSIADVSIRRLQLFKIQPNEEIKWRFGTKSGVVQADKNGLVTIPELTTTDKPCALILEK
ncbi:MAG: hypothetical protein IK077_06305 [Thermoguttaceae bacterium]|nr:hypothetical protein [Thermoguttaceae bacterium]